MRWILLLLSLPAFAQFTPPSGGGSGCGNPNCTVSGNLTVSGTTTMGASVIGAHANVYDWNNPLLWKWNTALAKTKITILLLGDSITSGPGWAQTVESKLWTLYGKYGPGISTANQLTQVGSWTSLANYGPQQGGGQAYASVYYASGTGNTIAYSGVTATAFDVWYLTNTDTSAGFDIKIDGVSQGTFGNSTSGSPTFAKATVSGLSLATHSCTVTAPASGNVYIFGIVPHINSTGVEVWNLGTHGATTAAFGAAATQLGFLSLLAPDLTVVSLGVNNIVLAEQATYPAQMATIISESVAVSPTLVLDENPINPATEPGQATISAQAYTAAVAGGAAWLSVYDRWGSYAAAVALSLMNADGVHPVAKGYADIAAAVINRLLYTGVGVGNSGILASFPGTSTIPFLCAASPYNALCQDANLRWDATNHFLGIGKVPSQPLDVSGNVSFDGTVTATTAIKVNAGATLLAIEADGTTADLGIKVNNTGTGGVGFNLAVTNNSSGVGGGFVRFLVGGTDRMVLKTGLNIGGLTDPGAGNLKVAGTVDAANGSTGHATCWNGTVLSYCTSIVAADGTCTCH